MRIVGCAWIYVHIFRRGWAIGFMRNQTDAEMLIIGHSRREPGSIGILGGDDRISTTNTPASVNPLQLNTRRAAGRE
jgi:hypothetical protein